MTATTTETTKQEKMARVLDTLEQGVASVLTSETYRAYLSTLARFHGYSFNNTILIMLARPEATRVAGFHTWKSMGRSVKKGEKGIPIMVPYARKITDEERDQPQARTVQGFGIGYVFDIAQTDGDELPDADFVQEISGDHDATPHITERLRALADAAGVTIVPTSDGPRGYWHPAKREIGIRNDLANVSRVKTLAHEIAHMLADHRAGSSREDAEDVAESAAYVTLAHFGIDSGEYSFGYVAGWAKDMAVVKRNLANVQRIAHEMIAAITA